MAMAAPLLVGTAAASGPLATGAALSTTAAGAATSGLFGSAGVFSLASTLGTLASGVSLFSSFMGNQADMTAGRLSAGAAEMEALQLEQQAENEKTRALQESTNRRQRLNQILNSQMAMTAGRGVAVGSGSDLAIASFSEEEFAEEEDIAASDSKFRQQQSRLRAQQARLGGYGSLMEARSRSRTRTFSAVTNAAERINTGKLFK